MNFTSRIAHRDFIAAGLGMVVDPIRRLLDSEPLAIQTIPYIESQFRRDADLFDNKVSEFCNVGKYRFEAEYNEVRRRLYNFIDYISILRRREADGTLAIPIDELRDKFQSDMNATLASLRAIPCDDPDVILPAESPFTTYLKLRGHFSVAARRIDLFDPYLSSEVFHRYLADVNELAMMQIITSTKVMNGGDTARRDRIVAVSELLAAERGSKYRFLVTSQQHDRHCRIDDEILHLGGSIVHASLKTPYTITRVDANQSNHKFLDGMISSADEWFGPTITVHRRS